MIVNLAPEERYFYDTYVTLNFARKTKKIVNSVRVNEIKDKSPNIIHVEEKSRKRSASDSLTNGGDSGVEDGDDEVPTPPPKLRKPDVLPLLRFERFFIHQCDAIYIPFIRKM